MKRKDARNYVSFYCDDCGWVLTDSQEVREQLEYAESDTNPPILVGWQAGFEPLFVAVDSGYDWELTEDEAIEIAMDYLTERDWFANGPRDPDFIIR